MKNINLNQVNSAEYLKVAMQIVGKSYEEIVTLLPSTKVRVIGDFLGVSFEDTILNVPSEII